MNINNEYIKVYLESLNNCKKSKIIQQQSYSNKQINCKITLYTKVSGQDNTGYPNDLKYFPNVLFSGNSFTLKQITGSKKQLIKGEISGITAKAYKSALAQNNRNSQLLKDKKYYCLVCFFIISQRSQTGITEYILTTNELNKIYLVIPDDRDFFQSVKTNLSVLSELHNEDQTLQEFTHITSMPFDILSVIWLGGKGIANTLVDAAKKRTKNSIVVKWLKNKLKELDE